MADGVNVGSLNAKLTLSDELTAKLREAADYVKQASQKIVDGLGGVGRGASDTSEKLGFLGQAAAHAGEIFAGLIAIETLKKTIESVGEAAVEAETSMARLTATVYATGGRVGLTVTELKDMASAMSNVTAFSHVQVEQAEQSLLKFGNIQGDTFKRVLKDTADAAALTGRSIEGEAQAIGRAIELPGTGYRALMQVGLVLDSQQKAMIKTLVESGQVAKAQAYELDLLEQHTRGLAEAMGNTLAGSWQKLKNRGEDLLEKIGEGGLTGAMHDLLDVSNSVASSQEGLAGVFLKIGFAIHVVTDLWLLQAQAIGFVKAAITSTTGTVVGWLEKLDKFLSDKRDKNPNQGNAEKLQALAVEQLTKAYDKEADTLNRLKSLFNEDQGQVGPPREFAGPTPKGPDHEANSKTAEKYAAELQKLTEAMRSKTESERASIEASLQDNAAMAQASVEARKRLALESEAKSLHISISELMNAAAGTELGQLRVLTETYFANTSALLALKDAKRSEEEEAKRSAEINQTVADFIQHVAEQLDKHTIAAGLSFTAQAALNKLMKEGGMIFGDAAAKIIAADAHLRAHQKDVADAAIETKILDENTAELLKTTTAIQEEQAKTDAIKKYGQAVADILDKHHQLTKAYYEEIAASRLLSAVQAFTTGHGGVGPTQDELANMKALIQLGVDADSIAQKGAADAEVALQLRNELISSLGKAFADASSAMGGANTSIGLVIGGLGRMGTSIADLIVNWKKYGDAQKAAVGAAAVGALQDMLKGLNVGGANKTGGTSQLGGKMESNYAAIGSMVGSIIGGILAAVYSWGIGTAGGASLGGAIGGLVGAMISKAGDSASAMLSANGDIIVGETSDKLNGNIRDALTKIFTGLQQTMASLGEFLTNIPLIDIKVRDNIVRVVVGGVVRTFSAMADAISFGITEAVKQATAGGGHGLPPEILAALKNTQATDVQSLQSDIDFAKAIANYGIPKVVQAIDKSISDYFVAMQRAGQLGIDSTKVTAQFIDQLKAQKDAILGISRNLSPQDQMKADAAAFNQKVALVRAEMMLNLVDLMQRKADLTAKVGIAGALGKTHIAENQGQLTFLSSYSTMVETKIKVDKAGLQAQGATLAASGDMIVAQATVTSAAFQAVEAAIAAAQAVIDGLVTISDQELQDALKHVGRGTGSGSNPTEDFIKSKTFDLLTAKMGAAQKALADLNKQYDDEEKGLKRTSEQFKKLEVLRQKEVEQLRLQTREDERKAVHDFTQQGGGLGSSISGIQDQAAALNKQIKDAFAAGAIGAKEMQNSLNRVADTARQMQFDALQTAAFGILQGLYDYLGMTEDSEKLKHVIAVAQLLAAQTQLKASLLMADLTPQMRAIIKGEIDTMGPLIEKVIKDPNYIGSAVGGGLTPTGAALRDYAAQQNANATNALQQLIDAFHKAKDGIRSFLDGIARGSAGLIAPQAALKAAQDQYQAMLAKAQRGDLTSLQNIPSAAQNLIDVMKNYSPALAATELPKIQEALTSLLDLPSVTDQNVTYTERFVAAQAITNQTLAGGFGDLSNSANEQSSLQGQSLSQLKDIASSQRDLGSTLARMVSGDVGQKRTA